MPPKKTTSVEQPYRHQDSILYAAKKGWVQRVILLLQNGEFVDTRDPWDETPLMIASYYGHLELVKVLLDPVAGGAHVNAGACYGYTALINASRRGHAGVVRLLIFCGATVHTRDNEGWSSLHHAAKEGHVSVLRILLSHGAHVECVNHKGWTSLMLSCVRGHLEATVELLNLGATIEAKDSSGQTALHHASHSSGSNLVIDAILSHGAAINSGGCNGETPLLLCSTSDPVRMLFTHPTALKFGVPL